jgi:hypothetical protein
MKLSDLGQFLRPTHKSGGLAQSLIDPLIALAAGTALVLTSGLGFAAFGVLIACTFLVYQLLTQVFGVHIELNPDVLRQYGFPPTGPQ